MMKKKNSLSDDDNPFKVNESISDNDINIGHDPESCNSNGGQHLLLYIIAHKFLYTIF